MSPIGWQAMDLKLWTEVYSTSKQGGTRGLYVQSETTQDLSLEGTSGEGKQLTKLHEL